MAEEPKDFFKGVDWKTVGGPVSDATITITANTTATTTGEAAVKKCLLRKMRNTQDYFFIPKRSLSVTVAIYESCVAAGIAAGMVVEVWTKKKLEEEGGVIWEFK